MKKNKMIMVGSAVLIILFLVLATQVAPKRASSVQKEIYQDNWGLIMSDSCEGIYFKETDDRWFGEGERYSVINIAAENAAMIDLSASLEEKVDKTSGSKLGEEEKQFLQSIWETLDVPDENRVTSDALEWVCYTQRDGSKLLVITDNRQKLMYIAEELF